MREHAGKADTTSVERRPRSTVAWLFIMLFGVLAAVETARILPRLDDMLVNEDGAFYMLLAQSLASGSGYRHLSSPGEPAHVLFPPAFPVVLAGLRLVGFESVTAAKVLVLIFAVAAVPVAFFVLKPRAGTAISALIAVWMMLHPDYLRSATKVSSDVPYLFWSLVALVTIRASARQPGWRDGAGVMAWLATVAAALTRAVGLPLAVAAPVYLAWSKAAPRWRPRLVAALLLAVCYGAPLVAWECWKAASSSDELGGYTMLLQQRDAYDWDEGTISGIDDITERLLDNARRCVRGLGGLMIGTGTDRQRSLIGLAALGLIAAGMVAAVRRGEWFVEAYLFLAAAATVTHPMPQLPRYLVPMLPFLLFYPAMLLTLAGRTGHSTAVVALALLVAIGVGTHDIEGREGKLRPAYGEYRATARWLGVNTPPDAVVLCRKPALMYLWSDRKSIAFPFSRDPALTDDRVERNGITHVVEDSFSPYTALFLEPWLRGLANDRALAHQNGNTRVWQLAVEARGQRGT